jgi:hypothetical protein
MKKLLRSPKPLTLACACVLAAAALAAAVSGSGRTAATNAARRSPRLYSARPAHAAHPLDPLDLAVQKRFHDVIGFGMARIATERRFAPETPEERAAVRELKRAGYKVGLYLAGRGILEPTPEEYRRAKTAFGVGMGVHGFSGPIFLSSSGVWKVPSAASLWGNTRLALLSFAEGAERYEFKAGRWEVQARPVRAEESCLRCHNTDYRMVTKVTEKGLSFYSIEPKGNTLKAADPLGVLLYFYKKSR